MNISTAWLLGSLFLAGAAWAKPAAQGPLPNAAKAAFVKMMRGTQVIPDKGWVSFTSDKQGRGPIHFTFTAGNKSGSGYATLFDKQWVFTTQRVTRQDLRNVTQAMVTYLKDSGFFEGWDETPQQIAKHCQLVRPKRTIWTGETSDPQNLVDSFPMVFSCTNPTGSDHGFFVGYNPKTKTASAYDFN